MMVVLQRGCCKFKKPRFKKRFSYQVPSKFSKDSDDRVYNPKSQTIKDTSSQTHTKYFGKCCKKHYGEFLVRTNNCFECF